MVMTLGNSLEFHHVGVACHDIEAEAARLALLGYRPEGITFTDSRQGVRGMFLAGQAPRLEVLEALPGAAGGVLADWLARDAKLYHLAYLAADLTETIENLRKGNAKLVVPPMPAVAFAGRDIAFVILPNRMLIELIAR